MNPISQYSTPLLSPRWLWFDLDDTLWDFKRNSGIALRLLFDTEKELTSRFRSFGSFADSYHAVNADLWRRYAAGEIDTGFLKFERFRAPMGLDDSGASRSLCDRLNTRYLAILASQTNINEGAEQLLQRAARSCMIGVLSNGFAETQYKKLYNTPLWRYVNRMVISDEIDVRKPDVRIYRYAEQAVGADASRCVMIGDNADTDIAGARAAGWQTVWYDPEWKGDVSSLSQIVSLLRL